LAGPYRFVLTAGQPVPSKVIPSLVFICFRPLFEFSN